MSSIGMDEMCLAKLTEGQKKAFLRAFIKMANVDGHVDNYERDFIQKMAIDFGLFIDDMDQFLKDINLDEIIADVASIKDRRVALELLKQLCVLAHADHVLSDDEVVFIGSIGQAMGIDPEKVEEISHWVIDYLVWNEQGKLIFEEV